MSKTIVFTGGGSAGHVTPNLAIIPLIRAQGFDVHYIGSKTGIERDIITGAGLPYSAVSSGKLRRYFSLKNFTDPFRILKGYGEAKALLKEIRPAAVFSKGGFVTVPVVYAAASLKIPVVLHESDYTPGLANRLSVKKADRICTTFKDGSGSLGDKEAHTGTPIRSELFEGRREDGLRFLGFDGTKDVLLVVGGSLGAVAINEALEGILPRVTALFDVAHIRGKGNLNVKLEGTPGYRQYEFISDELPGVFAAADAVLSRAGANAIFEFAALNKPALLIPLPLSASRGDQILNAGYFKKRGFAAVLEQEQMTGDSLYAALLELKENGHKYRAAMEKEDLRGAAARIADIIVDCAAQGK